MPDSITNLRLRDDEVVAALDATPEAQEHGRTYALALYLRRSLSMPDPPDPAERRRQRAEKAAAARWSSREGAE